jgi:NADH:ubiquinone oxidoreductase subunit F (NADH-binding)
MPSQDIISKLKKSGLKGRSGSSFPTGLKWESVKNAKASKKYVICNAAEGEPEVFKDDYILKNYPDKVIEGMKIALKTIDHSSGYIYINKEYFKKYGNKLKKLIGKLPISIFLKKTEFGKYIGGEETSLIESIEGKRAEPRQKPPHPTQAGLFGYPTLVNNVETFYYVSKINENKYNNERFYCISGEVKNKGVFEFPEDWTIKKVLKETDNWPDFNFFVQVGGGAEGEIFLSKELDKPVKYLASIIVFNLKTDPYSLMGKWVDFLMKGNCDKCVPCREGLYRLSEMIKKRKIDKNTLEDLFLVLEETSFCPLGRGATIPFKSLISKVLK